MVDFILVVVVGLVSFVILFVWWFIFHRWIYLQGVYSYRAREIEEKLNLWFNRYARLIEHWESEEAESLGKSELREKDHAAYDKLLLSLLGPQLRRWWALIHISNDEPFRQHDVELTLRLSNKRNLAKDCILLQRFKRFIGPRILIFRLLIRCIKGN